jgi:lipoprotein-anchoring transpeptidase ErfK/SrfK
MTGLARDPLYRRHRFPAGVIAHAVWLYLAATSYQGGQDTMFRLHGTNAPWSIGHAVSNGCIRMTNANIVDLL